MRLCSPTIILGRCYTRFFSKLLVPCRSSCPKDVLCFNNVRLHLEDITSIDLNEKVMFYIGQVSCDRYYILARLGNFYVSIDLPSGLNCCSIAELPALL